MAASRAERIHGRRIPHRSCPRFHGRPLHRRMVRLMLVQFGLEAIQCSNGLDALGQFKATAPGIISWIRQIPQRDLFAP